MTPGADITAELPKPRISQDNRTPAGEPAPTSGRASVRLGGTLYSRPVEADRTTVSLLARRLIGVREEVLSWVPEERARYTRLGLIVLNTGMMAAISLFTALLRVLDVPWLVVIPIALFWALLVITIDSWMVASTHGALGSGRWLMFLPRLAMAVLLGAVIAEPLVLWIFHPAIDTNVAQYREKLIEKETGLWTKCNPTDGSDTTGRPECAGHQLGSSGPAATQATLVGLEQQRTKLNGDYEKATAQRDEKQSFAEKECAGVKVGGTSGQEGWGRRCRQAWQVATAFERQINLPGMKKNIDALDLKIKELTGTLGTDRQSYQQVVEKGIADQVTEYKKTFGRVDIIEQANGLERLSHDSNFVWGAQWLVRALLIMLDSLPVLAKILGGSTFYDKLVNRQLRTGQTFHGLNLDCSEHSVQASTQAAMDEVDDQSRRVREHHDEDVDAEIDRRAQRYAAEMA
ncbi:hypothetical protein BJ973_007338 [Actinoplanes tereljensis]|uniref:DUF4407 domain-containing protein n=1 Tax=Paractinoplanes tereljensis TaxID=571912 RepID=A0A919NTS2_9ACTN|nr:DUF4407 domain-containing protein [Actinoplanes tereljensis]GIF25081.1 hypothetical protein Ate02nite_78110 [Actinoplanes tereljensis]